MFHSTEYSLMLYDDKIMSNNLFKIQVDNRSYLIKSTLSLYVSHLAPMIGMYPLAFELWASINEDDKS